MNTQTNPRRSTPMRLFSLATLVSSIVFVANRATADSLIIPPEFADREGSLVIGTVSNNPHRYHFLYLGSEFPQEPIDIIGMRRRPKSGTPTQSPIYRDLQVSLTTTNAAALNTDFVANFNMAVQPPTLVINGTVVTSTVRPVPDQSPRAFDYEFLWEETPFRFNPADGTNLLVDFRAPFGVSVPQQHDSIDARTQGSNTPLSVLESPANFFHGYTERSPVTEFIYNLAATTPQPSSWNIDSGGNWFATGNWTFGVPNGAGTEAVFGSAITSPHTVTVDRPITIGRLDFDSANAYTIAGSSILSLDATSGDAQINVASGSHTISAPLRLADNTTITVTPAASNLSLTGLFVGQNVTKDGAGMLTMNYVRATSLAVNGGTVTIAPVGTPAVTSMVGSLTIEGDGVPTAKLDLSNSAAIINYAGTSPAATVRQQIIAGRGGAGMGKAWNGQGITSSAAAAADPEARSVGYAENSALPLGPYTSFRGQSVDDTSLLMAFTRTGDANLDGIVNDDDVTIMGASYAPGVPQPSWTLGDFDYNGFVDDDDVTLLGAFYNPSAAPLITPAPSGAADVAAVPEPASFLLGVVAAAGIGFFAWRRPACVQ